MRLYSLLIMIVMTLGGCASSQAPLYDTSTWDTAEPIDKWTPHNEVPVVSHVADYSCERSQYISVSYFNLPDGDSYAMLWFNKDVHPMQNVSSSPGVRYVAMDDKAGYVWYSRGRLGVLTKPEPGSPPDEPGLLVRCIQV